MNSIDRIQFVRHKVASHRRHYVDEDDVKVVLSRLPEELWSRLRKVHFKDDAKGNRRFGYTTRCGRREITLCAMPHQKSVRVRTMGGEEFGALRGSQWPVLAMRRFMLYSTFLHELGHLQVVLPKSVNPNRKFASETLAQEFADAWRRKLWCEHFDHPDAVHNPPTKDELQALEAGWIASNLAYRKGQALVAAEKHVEAIPHLRRAIERYPTHPQALYLLGRLTYFGLGLDDRDWTDDMLREAASLLTRSVSADPASPEANLLLGVVLGRLDQQQQSRHYFEYAIRLDPRRGLARSRFAESLSRWGCDREARLLFENLLKRNGAIRRLVLPDYAGHLLHRASGDVKSNAQKALELLKEALGIDATDPFVHYHLGLAYSRLGAHTVEEIDHLREALRFAPKHEQAAALLKRLTAADGGDAE